MPRTQKVMENVQDNIDLQTANELYASGVEAKTLALEHRKTIDDTLKRDVSDIIVNSDSRNRSTDDDMIKKIRHNDTRSQNLKEGISGSEKMFVERVDWSVQQDVVKTGIMIYPGDRVIFSDIQGNAQFAGATKLWDIKTYPSVDGMIKAEMLLYPLESGSALVTVIRAH
jgi:hypothetical protein